MKIAKNRADMINKKFNMLSVIEYIETKNKQAVYKCRCDLRTGWDVETAFNKPSKSHLQKDNEK